MIEWAEFTFKSDKIRYPFLHRFLNELQFNNKFELLESQPNHFIEDFSKLKNEKKIICIDPSINERIMEHLESRTLNTSLVGWIDLLVKKNNIWWPHNLFSEALRNSIIKVTNRIDLNSPVLISGTTSIVKPIVLALVSMGFKYIGIIESDEEKVEALIKDLKKNLFLIHLYFIPIEEVVSLSSSSTLFINVLSHETQMEMLKFLFYFNFLQTNGLVIDLNLYSLDNLLLKNAEIYGAKTIRGFQVTSKIDQWMVEKFFGLTIDINQFQSAYQKELMNFTHN